MYFKCTCSNHIDAFLDVCWIVIVRTAVPQAVYVDIVLQKLAPEFCISKWELLQKKVDFY